MLNQFRTSKSIFHPIQNYSNSNIAPPYPTLTIMQFALRTGNRAAIVHVWWTLAIMHFGGNGKGDNNNNNPLPCAL